MKKILVHTCCTPCLIYPFRRLKEQGIQVSGFFYNPNIHPPAEYNNRKTAVEEYARETGREMFYPEYLPQEFFQAVNRMEDRLQRCPICWYIRLKKTAQAAGEQGFDAFSTTLLVSPYQDQDALHKIGSDLAQEAGIEFYYEDFRPGFRKAHDQARQSGMYCQKYCGCIYSELERLSRRAE